MSIDTWDKLIALPNAQYRYLIEMNPALFYACGSAWVSEGSNTYSHACTEEEVSAVTDDADSLTERTSLALVQANPGSWYFDLYAQTIYVQATGSDDLSNSSTDVTIVVYCWKYFSTDACIFNGHQYMPIVMQNSIPRLSMSVDDIVEGAYKLSFGSFQMMNTGYFDTASDDYLWMNKRVIIRLGGEALAHSEYATYFVGKVSDMDIGDAFVTYSVKDLRVGTFSQLPIDHYWSETYTNIRDEDEGAAIPLFYGVKESISPRCVDPDDEYDSHATSNTEGNGTFVTGSAIAVGTPASGTIVVIGNTEEIYAYSSWTGSTFTLDGVTLSRDYTDSDSIYVVGTNVWKIADREIKEFTEIRKNGVALTTGTHYTPTLSTASFILLVPFDATVGDELEVDGKGFMDGSSNLLTKGAEIAKDILQTYLGYVDDDLDLQSFIDTDASRTYELCIYLDTDVSSREVLQTIGRSIVAFLTPTEEGKLAFEAYEPTVPAGTMQLQDEDFYADWKVTKDDSYVRNKVSVKYNQNPKTQEYKIVERNNYEVLYKYGVRETLSLQTYLRYKADAETVAGGVRDMCSKPITTIKTSFGMKGFSLFPTRKAKISRTRAADTTGAFSEAVFRIKTIEKDTSMERSYGIFKDDLQTLGESFCYVCFSCQLCVTEEAGCSTCYECELCVASQGGCQSCDVCQLCDTDEGGCLTCDSCQSCDTCQSTVGTCETCQDCDTCQLCNNCQTTVNYCVVCQYCYGCDSCDSCQQQVNCESCDSCEHCVTVCQVCDTAQDCAVCDVCDTCEEQVTCAVCVTCYNCNSCQVCNTTEEHCSSCQVCDTCQASVGCSTCDTCENCNNCQACFTQQECSGCNQCDTCEICVNCEGNCDICEICVYCEVNN